MRAFCTGLIAVSAVISLVLAACGGQPPPKNEDSAGELPLVVPTGKGTPIETPPPDESAKPETPPPADTASAAAPPPPPSGPQDSRPPVLKTDAEEIQDTFGVSPGAKLELGDDSGRAILRIYENSFSSGVNVTFKIDTKAKSAGQQQGKIYRVTAVIPPSGTPEKVTSVTHPFELKLPAGAKKDANLAVGEIGNGKVTWRVIAPEKIDDATGVATFHLPDLFDYYLHITTRAVTEPKK